jgi:hypothetical protein
MWMALLLLGHTKAKPPGVHDAYAGHPSLGQTYQWPIAARRFFGESMGKTEEPCHFPLLFSFAMLAVSWGPPGEFACIPCHIAPSIFQRQGQFNPPHALNSDLCFWVLLEKTLL